MTPERERVAKAINEAMEFDMEGWTDALPLADAAIAAMGSASAIRAASIAILEHGRELNILSGIGMTTKLYRDLEAALSEEQL